MGIGLGTSYLGIGLGTSYLVVAIGATYLVVGISTTYLLDGIGTTYLVVGIGTSYTTIENCGQSNQRSTTVIFFFLFFFEISLLFREREKAKIDYFLLFKMIPSYLVWNHFMASSLTRMCWVPTLPVFLRRAAIFMPALPRTT